MRIKETKANPTWTWILEDLNPSETWFGVIWWSRWGRSWKRTAVGAQWKHTVPQSSSSLVMIYAQVVKTSVTTNYSPSHLTPVTQTTKFCQALSIPVANPDLSIQSEVFEKKSALSPLRYITSKWKVQGGVVKFKSMTLCATWTHNHKHNKLLLQILQIGLLWQFSPSTFLTNIS